MDETTSLQKLMESINELGEIFEVTNLTNLVRRARKLVKEVETSKADVAEFCAIAGYDTIQQKSNAKTKFRNLLEKSKSGISKKYGLDASFLEQKGGSWDDTVGGDTPEKIIRNWEKKVHDQRELVRDAYTFCLKKIEELAIEKGYTEEQICSEITNWHDAMREDFHTLTAPEFWQTYRGDFVGVDVLPTSVEEQLPLVEALDFVEEVTPERLYRDVRDCRKVIGKVSKKMYLKWEARATDARASVFKEGREKLQTLMVEIVGLAVHRVYIESDAIPTAEERSALFSILAPEAINPYASEFCVKDDTPMSTIAGHYQQLIGAGK